MGWMAAIPAIASVAGGLLGKKKGGGETVSLEQLMPSWQKQLGSDYSGWIQQYLKSYQPGQAYGGQLTTQATGQELTGLDQLTKFLGGSPTGDMYAAGGQQLMDTMGGKFADPNQSPWIKSMINLSKMNLQDQISEARGRRGARGTYYTKAGVQEEGKLGERTQNYLDSVIGQFMQGERDKQFQAAGMAPDYEKYGKLTAPLAMIGASQQYGGLQRTIDQANMENQYNSWLNQRKELSALPGQAQAMYGSNPMMGIPSMTAPQTQGNNSLGNILGMIGNLNWGGASGTSGVGNTIMKLFGG